MSQSESIEDKLNSLKVTLDNLIDRHTRVFIVPHDRADMDSLGACIGMSLICKNKGKMPFIVINDAEKDIEAVTKEVICEIIDEFNFINKEEAKNLIDDNSLLLVVDTNKKKMISLNDCLDDFKEIMVIDHHRTGEDTIETNNLFIDESISSTCEIVSYLLNKYGIEIGSKYATYLLSGIVLDTAKFNINDSAHTHDIVAMLKREGANSMVVNNMFSDDIEHVKKVHRLTDSSMISGYIFAIASEDDNSIIFDREDIAKAANAILTYKVGSLNSQKYQVDASFAMGYITEDTISISARSKGVVDVSKIMQELGGGGSKCSAYARVQGMSMEEIKARINELLTPTYSLDEKICKENSLTLKKRIE